MLKFEDSNKGSRRLLSEDEEDLGEVELDRLLTLLHPADAITEERVWAHSSDSGAFIGR
jgi:hypothetical protein